MFQKYLNDKLIKLGQFFAKPRSRSAVKKIMILLFTTTLVISTYLLSLPYLSEIPDYELGDIAREDIKVHRDIRYEIPEQTEKLKNEAYDKERLVFYRDYEKYKNVVSEIKTEMQLLVRTASESGAYRLAIERLPFLSRTKQIKKQDVIDLFAESNRKQVVDWAARYATLIFENYGLLEEPLNDKVKKQLRETGAIVKTINTTSEQIEIVWESGRIFHHEKIFDYFYYNRLFQLADPAFEKRLTPGVRKVVIHRLLQLYFRNPYLQYREHETKVRKEAAAEAVSPVTRVMKKGYTIARAGDPIDSDKREKIKILKRFQTRTNLEYITGVFLVMSVLALGVAFYIFSFSEFKLRDLSSHIILHSLILMLFSYAFLISRLDIIQESEIDMGLFIPVAFAGTMTGLLFGARVTLVIGVFIAFFLFMLSGYNTPTLFLSLMSSLSGIYAAMRMEKRTHFFKGAWIIGLSLSAVVAGFDLIHNEWGNQTRLKIILAFANGYVSTMLMSGIMPIYEMLFNLPTKFRLMELADFNQPVLKRLAGLAPSTYTHSLMMANLSERAVAAIGGNTLLTRVGCLYHDIGKMENPSFYTENKHLSPTAEKFKKLGPTKSAKMIISHVTDGIEMARKIRLPEKIISFIPEHHGTTTMQYFYHKALEENEKLAKPKNINREAYQYPGPMPQSKETGVVMLADSVEAASRSVDEPDRETFETLIDKIIDNKLSEQQFNECPLTMGDLEKIKATFVEVLLSSHHIRPKYPDMQKTRELEENAVDQNKNTSAAKSKSKSKPGPKSNSRSTANSKKGSGTGSKKQSTSKSKK